MSGKPWFTSTGTAALCATSILDFIVSFKRDDINLNTLPAVLTECFELGCGDQLVAALKTHKHSLRLVSPGVFKVVGPSGADLDVTQLQALSDEISTSVEPKAVGDAAAAPDALPYDTRAGPVLVHVDPLLVAQEICAGVVRLLQRVMPAATASGSGDASPAVSTATPSASPAGRVAHGAAGSAAGLDATFLNGLTVAPTANDSGEEFMAPYEVSFAADGAANVFSVPDVYNFAKWHIDYMTSPDTYDCRTYGRSILHIIFDALSVPSHEVVHLLQHAAGQSDHSRNSWQAEHDAARIETLLLLGALQELSKPIDAAFEETIPEGDARKRRLQPPPRFLAALCMLHCLRVTVSIRSRATFAGSAFAEWVDRQLHGAEPAAPPSNAADVMYAAIRGEGHWAEVPTAVVVATAAAEATSADATASASTVVSAASEPSAARGGAGASTSARDDTFETSSRAFRAYRRWVTAYGLWNPSLELEAAECTAYEDDAFKQLIAADGAASMLAPAILAAQGRAAGASIDGGASGGGGSGSGALCIKATPSPCAVARLYDESLSQRVLSAMFKGRVGEVHTDDNRAALHVNLTAASIPHVPGTTIGVLLQPVTDAATIARVSEHLQASIAS